MSNPKIWKNLLKQNVTFQLKQSFYKLFIKNYFSLIPSFPCVNPTYYFFCQVQLFPKWLQMYEMVKSKHSGYISKLKQSEVDRWICIEIASSFQVNKSFICNFPNCKMKKQIILLNLNRGLKIIGYLEFLLQDNHNQFLKETCTRMTRLHSWR